MGRVLAIEHRETKQAFAAKVLRGDYAEIPELRDRFALEVEMIAKARHPNVVRVFDIKKTSAGTCFYVMEKFEGETLSSRVARTGPMSVGQALDVACQLGSALFTVHRVGIVHRDVKPDNVFMLTRADASGHTVKLIDFGVAKVVSTDWGLRMPEVATTQPMVGSPRFMAPENVLGEAATAQSDVYSLGLLLHFMLRGALPFDDARGVKEIARAQVERAPEPIDASMITPELLEIIEKATAKSRADRYADMGELWGALRHLEEYATDSVRGARLPRVRPAEIASPVAKTAVAPAAPPTAWAPSIASTPSIASGPSVAPNDARALPDDVEAMEANQLATVVRMEADLEERKRSWAKARPIDRRFVFLGMLASLPFAVWLLLRLTAHR